MSTTKIEAFADALERQAKVQEEQIDNGLFSIYLDGEFLRGDAAKTFARGEIEGLRYAASLLRDGAEMDKWIARSRSIAK